MKNALSLEFRQNYFLKPIPRLLPLQPCGGAETREPHGSYHGPTCLIVEERGWPDCAGIPAT